MLPYCHESACPPHPSFVRSGQAAAWLEATRSASGQVLAMGLRSHQKKDKKNKKRAILRHDLFGHHVPSYFVLS